MAGRTLSSQQRRPGKPGGSPADVPGGALGGSEGNGDFVRKDALEPQKERSIDLATLEYKPSYGKSTISSQIA